MTNFYKNLLEKINPESEVITMKISDFEGNSTKHFNLNSESIPLVIEFLQSIKKPTEFFDDYEIHGCYKGNGIIEQCDDNEAQFFCLFGHLNTGGLQSIGDFETREEAEEVLQKITRK